MHPIVKSFFDWLLPPCPGGKVDEAARETQKAGNDIKKDGQH